MRCLSIIVGLTASACVSASYNQVMYDVEVINLTYLQPLSPVVVVVHSKEISIFEEGGVASSQLKILAEDGDAAPLLDLLEMEEVQEYVCGVSFSAAPIFPGESFNETIYIETSGECEMPYVSSASMLINTNDAFMGIESQPLPPKYGVWYPPAYDAGTELNNEDCSFIPGPGCADISSENMRTDEGEGFIHIHRGMQDVTTDLPAASYDWRNGVAKVSLTAMY
ncbi:unnamed protein product [Choristocarpus tenellus]